MRKKKKTPQNRPVEATASKAANLLATGHYKEAIEVYKRLLKQESRDEWQTALAKVYLLRARALADKGMYKEATVLWENRANIIPDQACLDQYIDWLIKIGRYIQAARLFSKSTEHLSDNAIRQLQAQLGTLLLVGNREVMEAFPQDTPLLTHYDLIKEALQAYFRSDDKVINEYLKKIPFRSPYRDFRPILKALLVINTDLKTAHRLLEKVLPNSPYAHFARLLQMVGEEGETLLENLSQLSSNERSLIACLKGWDKAKLKVISRTQTAAKQGNDKALLQVVATNKLVLGENYSRQFCLALLPSYPPGVKLYEKAFGRLSAFDKHRITALNFERQGDFVRADKFWRLGISNLEKHQESQENNFKIALILHHLVELADKRGEVNEGTVEDDLIKSINIDPDDKISYLQLIQWYQDQDNKKSYHKWADIAVKQFPQESDVLLVGIESATRKKAFKKAAGFAKNLLKVDPINVKARQIARTSHVSHARKQIRAGKYELARKELKQAAQFEKTSRRSGIVQINQGLLELQAEGLIESTLKSSSTRQKLKPLKSKKSKQNLELQAKRLKSKLKNNSFIDLIQEGFQLSGSGILGQFRLISEAKSQYLEPTFILSLISPLDKGYIPTKHEVLELINLITVYSEENITFVTETIEQLKPLIQKSIKLDFTEDEMFSLCECLKKVEHYELLKRFADQSLKRWFEHPAFIYYQIYAQSKGRSYHIHNTDFERLQKALDEVERRDDQRTSVMIINLLRQLGPMSPFFNPSNDFDDVEEELENLMNNIEALKNMDLDDINPADLIKLLRHLEEMGIEIPPDISIPKKR